MADAGSERIEHLIGVLEGLVAKALQNVPEPLGAVRELYGRVAVDRDNLLRGSGVLVPFEPFVNAILAHQQWVAAKGS